MTTIAYITSSDSTSIYDAHISDVQNILAIVSDYVKKHPGNGITTISDQWVLALSNIPYTIHGSRSSQTSRVKGKVTGKYLLSPVLLEKETDGEIDQPSMEILNDLAASIETELQADGKSVEALLVSIQFISLAQTIGIPFTVIGLSFSDSSTILSIGRQITIQKSTLLFDYENLSDPRKAEAWKQFVASASWEKVSQDTSIVRISKS